MCRVSEYSLFWMLISLDNSGLDDETLKLGVWKGDISLENLGLKTEALNGLDLPFVFDSGIVKRLQVKVPWKKIKTEPVIITLDGVYAVILPRPSEEVGRFPLDFVYNFECALCCQV